MFRSRDRCVPTQALLLEIFGLAWTTAHRMERLEKLMSEQSSATAELNTAVSLISDAVADASAGIKDIAAKLAEASSIHPGEIQDAAAKLTALANGLEAVVAAAGEPVSHPAEATEEPTPATDAAPVEDPAVDPQPAEPVEA